MAPLKFEEELKGKLEGREIKPSIHAWDKISNELDTVQKPKRKHFWSYGIAASIIGLLLVSIWFFIADSEVIPEISNIENKEEVKKKNNKPLFETPNEVLVTVDEINKPVTEEKEDRPKKVERQRKNLKPKTPTVIADVELKKEQNNTIVEPVFEDKIMEKQLSNVLEAVAQLEANNSGVSDIEVDSLLRQAQREILKEKALEAGISIDAMALLYEVEGELDKTFREKVLEKLKDGFQKVRTAVADRNN